MPRFVVLLRGINVGRAKRLAMADLRALLTDQGYAGVRTVLQSGNAVVDGPADAPEEHAARVAAAIRARLGLDVVCIVLTAGHLRAVAAAHPFADVAVDGSRMMVHVLSADPDPVLLAAHDPVALDPRHVRLGDRVIYQWCPDGLLAAPAVGPFVEKRLGVAVTARNWNTVGRLDGLVSAGR